MHMNELVHICIHLVVKICIAWDVALNQKNSHFHLVSIHCEITNK